MNAEGSVSVAAPSEIALSAAIDRLSEIQFQEFAERFARLRDPTRFDRLEPVGRTERMKATSEWGDGQVVFVDGQVDVVEATTSARPRQHLNKDIETIKARYGDRLRGFLFISSARRPQSELAPEVYGELEALGVPGERIDLVFRELLLSELRRPRFATLWPGLGCPVTSTPFTPIEGAEIFGDPHNEHHYVPGKEAFESGEIPWLKVHTGLWERLQNEHLAIVRGMRGAGKTVLAAQLGFRWSGLDLPCLYLDLGAQQNWSNHELLATITARSDGGVLFVIDNIHNDEGIAAEIHRLWRSRDDGSALLLLGRPAGESEHGVARPLAQLAPVQVQVTPSAETIASVLELETKRHGLGGVTANAETRRAWGEKFGSDLVVLITAIRERLEAIAQGDLNLSLDDAVAYVRDRYLHPSDEAVNADLAKLAVAAQIEIGMPGELLDPKTIDHGEKNGLLSPRPDRRPGHLRYFLPHPALSSLLLRAHPADETETLSGIAVRSPSMLTEIVGRLRGLGFPAKAALVARHAVDALDAALVSNLSLSQLAVFIAQIEGLTAVPQAALDETLSREPERLARVIARGRPDELVSFLEEARLRLPLTMREIRKICKRREIAERYANLSLRAGAETVKSYLSETMQAQLPTLVRTQLEPFKSEETAMDFVARAFQADAGAVADAISVSTHNAVVGHQILALLESKEGPGLLAAAVSAGGPAGTTRLAKAGRGSDAMAQAVGNALLDERCLAALDRLLLSSDLAAIGNLLHELRGKPKVQERCLATVTAQDNCEIIERAALASPIGNLPRFLDQIRDLAPDLHEAVGAALAEPAAVEAARAGVLERPKGLNDLKPFLLYTQDHLPELFEAFRSSLGEERIALPLAEAIARIEKLNEVTTLFATLYELMPETGERVGELVIASPRVELLVYSLARSSNQTQGAFTRTFELAGEVWDEMPAELWAASCRLPGRSVMRAAELGNLLREIGRPELETDLSTATAETIGAWDEVRTSLLFSDIAWILNRCRPNPGLLGALGEKVLTTEWLSPRRLSREPLKRVAELACACWALGDEMAERLLGLPELRNRATTQLGRDGDLASALKLVGILSLAGRSADLIQGAVNRSELADLLERHFRAPFKLDAEQAVLFLGVTELAAAHRLRLDLPPGGRSYLLHLLGREETPKDGRRALRDLLEARLAEVVR